MTFYFSPESLTYPGFKSFQTIVLIKVLKQFTNRQSSLQQICSDLRQHFASMRVVIVASCVSECLEMRGACTREIECHKWEPFFISSSAGDVGRRRARVPWIQVRNKKAHRSFCLCFFICRCTEMFVHSSRLILRRPFENVHLLHLLCSAALLSRSQWLCKTQFGFYNDVEFTNIDLMAEIKYCVQPWGLIEKQLIICCYFTWNKQTVCFLICATQI